MRILDVRYSLNKLKQVSKKVRPDEMVSLKKKLLDTYASYNYKLQGLSLIQIGIEKRGFLIRLNNKKPLIVFNPELFKSIGSIKSNEGCVSEPGYRYDVKRPLLIYVGYYNEDNRYIKRWFTYKIARIFMHELDHCNGILLRDKVVN